MPRLPIEHLNGRPGRSGMLRPGVNGILSAVGIAVSAGIAVASIAVTSNLEDPGPPKVHATSAVVLLGLTGSLAGGRERRGVAHRAIAIAGARMAASLVIEAAGGFG